MTSTFSSSAAQAIVSAVIRVALYARISEDDKKDVLGVKRQIHDGGEMAVAKGWQVAGEYIDNDLRASGDDLWRPEFERLLEDVRAGQIDAIIATEPERITRRPKELEKILEVCEEAGVKYIAYVHESGVDIGTGDGILMARFRAAIAAHEVAKIKRRVKDKKNELARDGKPSGGGRRPFGYTADYSASIKAEAAMIEDAAARVLDGESMRSICAGWNAAGQRTSTGGEWRPSCLRSILKSGRIAGLREHHGVVTRKAVWPAIIDRDTHDQLVALLDAPGRRRGKILGHNLLTGLLVCGRPGCDGKLVSSSNNGHRAYACRTDPGRAHGCNKLVIKAEPLEDWIRDAALERLDENLLAELKAQRAGAIDKADLDRIDELEAHISLLNRMLGSRKLSEDDYNEARVEADPELKAAYRKVERQRTRTVIDAFLDDPRAVPERWEAASLPVKRAVLAAILKKITVRPAVPGRARFDDDRIDPDWRY
jgi:DNA invertase Pin-like site-specific DNA recombinase